MALQAGIVGLPNVGKSTLFNAVSNSAKAQASNYRFCTIDPNVGLVDVPDARMAKLAELVNLNKLVPTQIEIVDIAGLVRGASKGEGLGKKFWVISVKWMPSSMLSAASKMKIFCVMKEPSIL